MHEHRLTGATAILAGVLFGADAASAANFVVNTLSDTEDAAPGNGVAADASGNASLRAAITESLLNGEADTISFAPALYAGGEATITLTLFDSGIDMDELGPSAFIVDSEITIAGPSGGGIALVRSASASPFRLFHVQPGGTLRLRNLRLSGGLSQGGDGGDGEGAGGGGAGGIGGALLNEGTLELDGCALVGNTAVGGKGGFGGPWMLTGGIEGRGGGGGGGVGADGAGSSDYPGAAGGNPNGGPSSGAGGTGGGGGGGYSALISGIPWAGGPGGPGGPHGGGGGGGTGPPYPGAGGLPRGGDGGAGGLGGGGGGGGQVANALDFEGAGGAGGFGGGGGGVGGFNAFPPNRGGDGGGGAGMGGALYNRAGIVTITRTTLSGNLAAGGSSGGSGTDPLGEGQGGDGVGGAIFNESGLLTITTSTIAANSVLAGQAANAANFGSGDGGAILNIADMTIENSTISGNAGPAGSNHAQLASFTFVNALLRNVTVIDVPGSTYTVNGTFQLANTIIRGSCTNGFEILSTGGNVESPGNSCQLMHASDQVNVSPAQLAIAPLGANGGPTQTHALPGSSVAVESGVAACPATDQRGFARPAGANCDAGAYEFGATAPTIPSLSSWGALLLGAALAGIGAASSRSGGRPGRARPRSRS